MARTDLFVSVLRFAGCDCTNSGVTSRHNYVTVYASRDVIPEDADKDTSLVIVRRNIGGRPYIHAEPIVSVNKGSVGWMAGGNHIASSSSSMWNEFLGQDRNAQGFAIPVHDRQETVQQYATMCD